MNDDIVHQYLKKGKLLTPDALKELMEKGAIGTNGTGFVVTRTDITAGQTSKRSTIRILKNITDVKNELTADDFARFYKSKYDRMKSIFASRVQKDFVSLNKLDNYRDEVHAIGMVRSMRDQDGKVIIDLEDPTAVVPIVFGKDVLEGTDPQPEEDDVIAVRAVSARSVMYGRQIVWPDVPLRQPATAEGKLIVAPSLHLDEAPDSDITKVFSWIEKQDIESVFFVGDIGDTAEFERLIGQYCYAKTAFVVPGERDTAIQYPSTAVKFSWKNVFSLSNPSIVEINGIRVLLSHSFSPASLKKRYIGRARRITGEDHLTLEEVPDLVLFNHYKDQQVVNYKAVTMVNPGSLLAGTNATIVDLATREVQQVAI
jgi:DNA polymerase II small subunit/DNA polymerase delta subunit B